MENASKALIIAGSILLAMITISIFYFSFGKVGEAAESVSENTDQKELMAFNSSFEAYNKKVMYGADILSVINKAIDNNRSYGVEYYEKPTESQFLDYYVNVIFKYQGQEYNLMRDYTKPITASSRNIIQKKYIDMAGKSDKDPQYKTDRTYRNEVDEFHTFKFTAFKCTDVKYTKKSDIKNQVAAGAIGRVRELKFELK